MPSPNPAMVTLSPRTTLLRLAARCWGKYFPWYRWLKIAEGDDKCARVLGFTKSATDLFGVKRGHFSIVLAENSYNVMLLESVMSPINVF